MTASRRFSTLGDRHRAMGSELEDRSGMGTAWSYDKDQTEEYLAIRTKAGFMDVSGLKKVHVVGPHASHVIDRATTRDVERISPGPASYACMLNDAGKFIDDCVIYRTGANSFMVVHGSGEGHEQLTRAAMGRDVSIHLATTCTTSRCKGRWPWSFSTSTSKGSATSTTSPTCRPGCSATR